MDKEERIGSFADLRRYCQRQLEGYKAELYGYNSHNDFVEAFSIAFFNLLSCKYLFNYGDELPDQEGDFSDALDMIDLS